MSLVNKQKIVELFLEKNFLVSEEAVAVLDDNLNINFFCQFLQAYQPENFVITPQTIEDFSLQQKIKEHKEESNLNPSPLSLPQVKILTDYKDSLEKKSVEDFIEYFNKRYTALKNYLIGRQDLQGLVSISRVKTKIDREQVSIIGMVKEKTTTKNDTIIFELEDPTGQVTVLVNKNSPEAYQMAKITIQDEVIGITGAMSKGGIFANRILVPDVPLIKEMKKAPNEEYALFISDIHVGSRYFLEDNFMKFIKWLNGEVGNEVQKELVNKVKYIFVVGDLVDGVGVYPLQEKELVLQDIREQYAAFAKLFALIPKNKLIIMCPGNHDATRLEEPQPPVDKDLAPEIYSMENMIFVQNPSIITVGATKDFEGIDIMMYHGHSFDYFISSVDEIRNNGGYDRGDLVMKYLLQRRHLCPTHGSTVYIPDCREDPLVIKKIPDILATGHIHKCAVSNYRNVTLISGSCWQDTTPYQKKLGHHPEPCRVPMINLKTREARILRF